MMKKSDFDAFVGLWSAAMELYRQKPSDAAIAMAFRALFYYPLEDVRGALDAHIHNADTGRFAPTPADLVKHIDGDPKSRALQAWTTVQKSIERIGPHESVTFDDPAIMAALSDMGGWIVICEITDKDLPFRRNEFCTRYLGYLNRPPETHPGKLLGHTEGGQHEKFADFTGPPILIGDPEKAKQILKAGKQQRLSARPMANLLPELPNAN